jgi:hypothetical protein
VEVSEQNGFHLKRLEKIPGHLITIELNDGVVNLLNKKIS